jgi:hypothetical protein
MTLERDALGEDSLASRQINRRIIRWWVANTATLDGVERQIPVTVAVSVFSAHPPDKIAVVETKA